MNCSTFEDHLSDYLEAALDSRAKAECAAHRLVCRDCRALYSDVRATVIDVGTLALAEDIEVSPVLATRILAATTPGMMLSCSEFDLLIERYFDGVLLPTEFQIFQNHFDQCRQCRRLLGGIEDAIALCHEAKEEIIAPADLPERIVAATTGGRASGRFHAFLMGLWATLNTPQWAVALLILAAATTLLSARFASLHEFKAEAQVSAERLQANGKQARTQLKMATTQIESMLNSPTTSQTVNWQHPPLPANQWNVTARPASTHANGHPVGLTPSPSPSAALSH